MVLPPSISLALSDGDLSIVYHYLETRPEGTSMEENERTIMSAHNYVNLLLDLRRFEEAKALLRKTIPVARRVLGACNESTLKMRSNYASTLYADPTASLDDVREAVRRLEDIERTARRVLGGAHPTVAQIEQSMQYARDTLCVRETPPPSILPSEPEKIAEMMNTIMTEGPFVPKNDSP